MNRISEHQFFCFTLSLAVFISVIPLPVFAMAHDVIIETRTTKDDDFYVYLGEELSSIAYLVKEISTLENDQKSMLHQLKDHIDNGFSLAEYNAVFYAMEDAERILEDNYTHLDNLYAEKLFFELTTTIKQLINGSLTINTLNTQSKPVLSNIKRSYINIMQVKGLLSVNDELVQNITAVNLSATDEIVSSSLKIVPFNTAGIVHNDASGNLSTSLIVNADVSTSAAIVDTKLATISTTGKVANSATTATAANTASAIVARDASGNFAASIVSMTDGVASGNLILSTEPSSSTAGNILKGSNRFIHDFGTANTFVGLDAGNFTMSGGGNNTGIGYSALTNNTTGAFNVGVGSGALQANTIGSANVAMGLNTLTTNSVGNNNVAIGSGALQANTTGSNNTALGYDALFSNTTGVYNTAVGSQTLQNNLTGISNTALGYGTLFSVTSGFSNIAIGSDAGGTLTTGFNNIYINANAGTAAESSTTRIGTSQTQCFVTGINGVTPGGSTNPVIINSSGQLGTTIATSANTPNTLVLRDGAGNFSAGTITANLTGNATTATTATNFTGSLLGDVTGTQSATVVSTVGGQTAANVAAATLLANAATNLNTASAIVRRDGSGNFSAGTITASLSGNATTATTATNFTGSLLGDVTGTQGATVVSFVGGQTAANVAAATVLANAATNLNTASTIVERDAAGNFAASIVSMTDGVHSGNLVLSTNPSTSTTGNIIKGSSRFIHNFGTNNTFVGINAGNFTMSGSGGNTAVGVSALTANTTGFFNTAVGSNALTTNTTGVANTAVGQNTLRLSTGINNTAVGTSALEVNTANGNTAVGSSALSLNTTATNNTAVGSAALQNNTTGVNNTAIGAITLSANTIGTFNTAVGSGSLGSNTTGSNNTAVGASTLVTNTTGANNTAVGSTALNLNTIGINNVAVGTSALSQNTTGIDNTALGYNALAVNTTGTNNIAIGSGAGGTLTTGSGNIYINANAGSAAEGSTTRIGTSQTQCFVTGINGVTPSGSAVPVIINANGQLGSITLGTGVVHSNASGNLSSSLIVNADVDSAAGIVDTKLATISTAGKVSNSATTATAANTASAIVARDASGNVSLTDSILSGNLVFTGATSTSTTGNITKGGSIFIHNTGTSNTFVGIGSGNVTLTGNQNTAIGVNTLTAITTGINNLAAGILALNANTTGSNNVGLGGGALQVNTTGGNNMGVGFQALTHNTSGASNTAVGYQTLVSVTTGSNNIALGNTSGGVLTTGSGNIYIDSDAGSASEATTIRIGTSQTVCAIAGISGKTSTSGVAVLINTSGVLGTTTSSARYKHNIIDMNDSSADVLTLRPVTFAYNNDETESTQYGLIAEEVEEIFPDIVVRDEEGQPETIQYHILPVLLLNEMKKQQATIDQMGNIIATLQSQVQEFIERVKVLEAKA